MTLDSNKRNSRYERIFQQINALIKDQSWPVAIMATIAAVLHHKFDYYFWTGFYLLTEGELIVGPYQGPVACIKLKKHSGVCWAGINRGETIIVPDVHQFPGHIACDSRSNSEIVVPLRNKSGVISGVLDVDSKSLDAFNEIDAFWLEKITGLINTQ
ncbi:MAG: GAF domain-containing protein [Bacteroidetes bacterium]|nr:GAF domain-containing protein [Bacteroidota bacterium]